jgi:hypothetical protein
MNFTVSPDVPGAEGTVLPPVVSYPSVFAGKTTLAASVSPQGVDLFLATVFRATKYVLTIEQGANYQAVEILLMSDGTNTFIEVSGSMSSTGVALATFSADTLAGVVVLEVTLITSAVATVNFQAIRVLA